MRGSGCHVGEHGRCRSMPGASSIGSSAPPPSASPGAPAEHAALGHIQHALAAPQRLGAAEGAVLDLRDELRPVVQDVQVAHRLHLQRPT